MNNNLIYCLIFFSILACDFPEHFFSSKRECINQKEFSEMGNPYSSKYQSVVLEHLSGRNPKEFRYYFQTFLEEGRRTYMMTNFRNENSCFDVKILVQKWDKLGRMRRVNGRAYPNELYDLDWEFKMVDNKEEVVYVDMHKIID